MNTPTKITENIGIETSMSDDRKNYSTPEVVFDQELETRAGSPLSGIINPFDLDSE